MADDLAAEAQRRRSIRLKGFDYTQAGAYFVTICAQRRCCLFGSITSDEMQLNACGQAIVEEWLYTGLIRPNVVLDEFVVMPNHLHGIVMIVAGNGAGCGAGESHVSVSRPGRIRSAPSLCSPRQTIGAIVRGFKASSTNHINVIRGTQGMPVWQRNYYEHIVRNDVEMDRIRSYIAANPARWDQDKNNPEAAQ